MSSGGKNLGWFLCWAVVFADVGTSLYYVPGILFGDVKSLAGLFVCFTSIVFVLLSLKYIDISERYHEGGGVVTVATHAFNSWVGALGGMFITVDYFLTASISSVSGFAYLNSIIPISKYIVLFSAIGVALLGVLNYIGIKESATVTAFIATAAFIVDVVLAIFVATQVGPEGWQVIFSSFSKINDLDPLQILAGFAGAFLAFSGLESISQLSPAMRPPRKRTATIAMAILVVVFIATSPILTSFSTNLLTAKLPSGEETILEGITKIKEREAQLLTITDLHEKELIEEKINEAREYSERFISELGAQYGGPLMKLMVVITASILLLFASNTAIIGAYHVFIALARQNFLPQILLKHNVKYGTPHWSIILATLPPIIIIFATQGNVIFLGQLYAFGLLGAFALSSLGLDIVRWRERKTSWFNFTLGIITTLLVFIAWGTNLVFKTAATLFGGILTIIGMGIAFYNKRKTIPVTAMHAVKLAEVTDVRMDQVFIPVYDEFDHSLFHFAGDYARKSKKEIILLYIREFSDILQTVSENIDLDPEASDFLYYAKKIMKQYNVKIHLLYTSSSDVGETINQTRKLYKPETTIISPHSQSMMINFPKGDVVKKVFENQHGNVILYSGTYLGEMPSSENTPNNPAAIVTESEKSNP